LESVVEVADVSEDRSPFAAVSPPLPRPRTPLKNRLRSSAQRNGGLTAARGHGGEDGPAAAEERGESKGQQRMVTRTVR